MPKKQPYLNFDCTELDIMAIKALAQGTASEGQQLTAIRWILEQSGTHDQPYRSDERDTLFACGMMHVGKQIIRLIHMDLEKFRKAANPEPKTKRTAR